MADYTGFLPRQQTSFDEVPPALPPRPPRRQSSQGQGLLDGTPGRGGGPDLGPLVPRRMTNKPPLPNDHSPKIGVRSKSLSSSTSQYISTTEGITLGMDIRGRSYSKDYGTFEEQEWYWGNISKEEVTEIMKDKPDGSFLVRDAARNPGNFTLTLRKDGVNRLIRIYYRDGYFGFAEPLEFSSVMALIEYYQEHSLQPYSPKLDITLMEPVSKYDSYEVESEGPHGRNGKAEPMSFEKMSKDFQTTEQELRDKNTKYNELSDRFEKTSHEISSMRLEMSAQQQIILMLKEHIAISEKVQNDGSGTPEHRQQVIKNFQALKRRYSTQEHSHKELEARLHRTEQQKNQLDTERNLLKPIIKSLQEQKQQQMRYLNQRGYRASDFLAEGVEEDNPDDLYATYAMLHTYREDAADYQRISEQIQRKKKKPVPPLPPQYQSGLTDTIARPSHRPPPSHPPVSHEPTIPLPGEISIPSSNFESEIDGHLINYKQMELPTTLPHFQSSSWTRDHISRDESRDLLNGRPDGTFLVRPKPGVTDQIPQGEPLHTHTIDIVDEGKFKRIPVFRGPGGGYGFAHPFEFDSLLSLVCYYATNTMQRHNDSLQNTMLAFPAFLKQ